MIRHIARSTVRALAWLHSRRIVHRDVKPHNLLLHCELQPTSNIGYTGGGWQTLLSDFGIMARLKDADDVSRTLVGTLQYMSPERLVGSSYSYAADVWSCGLVMATAALGYVPLDATQGHWGLVHHIQSREIRLPERIEVGQTRAGMLLSPLGSQSPARARPNHNETGEVRIFSAAFRDFIAKCLERDPEQRASAESLLRHPFVVGSGSEAGDEAEARLHWSLVHQAMTRQAQCTADAATHDKYVASIVSRIKSRTAVGDREETLRRLSRTLNLSVDMLSSMWDQC
jgi:serine/threonine protein kinase